MFEYFPTVMFQRHSLVDITKALSIQDLAKKNESSIYFRYTMKVWRSPENVAFDFYGDCDKVYLIYLANNIVNPFTEWFLKDEEVKRLAVDKYGKDNIYNIHHYRDETGYLYSSKPEHHISVPVTNLEYETERNEERRTINVIYPELVTEIEVEIQKLMGRKANG